MGKIILFFCIGFSLCSCLYQKVVFKAFTHPYGLGEIPVYSRPNKLYSYLQSDTEGGWIVEIRKQKAGYLYVTLPADCDFAKKDILIKSEDVGVVIQNYDSIQIPMYISADTLSNPTAYIYASTIGSIYAIEKELVLLKVRYDNKDIQGWIEKKYLCGNPYTTCN